MWSFFDDAIGKVIGGIKGALGFVKFIFLYMYKPSRSSMVWESRCRRDTGPVLRRAARVKDFSSPAEASARIELLLRRGSSRDGAPPKRLL
jgi:hypothetical protein